MSESEKDELLESIRANIYIHQVERAIDRAFAAADMVAKAHPGLYVNVYCNELEIDENLRDFQGIIFIAWLDEYASRDEFRIIKLYDPIHKSINEMVRVLENKVKLMLPVEPPWNTVHLACP